MKKIYSFWLILICLSFVGCSDNNDKIEEIIHRFKDSDQRELFSGLIVFIIRGHLDIHFYWKGGRVDRVLNEVDFYDDNLSTDIIRNEQDNDSLKIEIFQRFKRSIQAFLSLNIMGVSGTLDNRQIEFYLDGEEVLSYFDSPNILSDYIQKKSNSIQEKQIKLLNENWVVYKLKNPIDKY